MYHNHLILDLIYIERVNFSIFLPTNKVQDQKKKSKKNNKKKNNKSKFKLSLQIKNNSKFFSFNIYTKIEKKKILFSSHSLNYYNFSTIYQNQKVWSCQQRKKIKLNSTNSAVEKSARERERERERERQRERERERNAMFASNISTKNAIYKTYYFLLLFNEKNLFLSLCIYIYIFFYMFIRVCPQERRFLQVIQHG